MDSVALAAFISLLETYQFMAADMNMMPVPTRRTGICIAGDVSVNVQLARPAHKPQAASYMMIIAARNISTASMRPEKSSNLPWPNKWSLSGARWTFLRRYRR